MQASHSTRRSSSCARGQRRSITVLRVDPNFVIQLIPSGTPGLEHYAFAASANGFEEIFDRIKAAGIAYGPSFDKVGTNTGPGEELGARGPAPTLYFNDTNEHLLEIRYYAD